MYIFVKCSCPVHASNTHAYTCHALKDCCLWSEVIEVIALGKNSQHTDLGEDFPKSPLLHRVLSVLFHTAAIPSCHVETDDAFNCSSVDVCRGEPSPLRLPVEKEPFLGFVSPPCRLFPGLLWSISTFSVVLLFRIRLFSEHRWVRCWISSL